MHKCFISFHREDSAAVAQFVQDFDVDGRCFIARAVGVSQDIIDSSDAAYIMRRIRDKYLTDSTVTMVMIGRCTWARRFVDWEIASSLRNDVRNRRSGLMAITLPYMDGYQKRLPPRLDDNWAADGRSYAKWWKYPSSFAGLESMIDEAYEARERLAHLVNNKRQLFGYNRDC